MSLFWLLDWANENPVKISTAAARMTNQRAMRYNDLE